MDSTKNINVFILFVIAIIVIIENSKANGKYNFYI